MFCHVERILKGEVFAKGHIEGEKKKGKADMRQYNEKTYQ